MSVDAPALASLGQPKLVLLPPDESWVTDPPRGAWKAKVQRFIYALRDPAVFIPGAVLLLIVLACFLGPVLFNIPGPNIGDLSKPFQPVGSAGHLLGTNNLGNDTLSRILHGGQVSLVVGLGATGIGLVLGSALGRASSWRSQSPTI